MIPFLTLKRPSRSGNSSIKIRMHQKPQIRLFLQSEVLRFKTYNKMSRNAQKPKFQRFMPCNQTANNNTKTAMKNLYYKITNFLLQNPILSIGLGRMIGILLVFIYVILCQGCSTNPKAVEGTSIQLGAYLPFDGNLYGVELMSYVNGLKIQASSNQSFQVDRTYTSTNEWAWGLLKSVEGSDTKIQVGSSSTNNVVNTNK